MDFKCHERWFLQLRFLEIPRHSFWTYKYLPLLLFLAGWPLKYTFPSMSMSWGCFNSLFCCFAFFSPLTCLQTLEGQTSQSPSSLASTIHETIQKMWVSSELTRRHAIVTLQCYFPPARGTCSGNHNEWLKKQGWANGCSIQHISFALASAWVSLPSR